MIRNICVGIDIGSSAVRVVVGEFLKGEKNPKVIGAGEAPSIGIRQGYILDNDSAVDSVRSALINAEKSAGIKIKRAYVAASGLSLRSETSSGLSIVSKADGEVTTLDINKALADCEENLSLGNKKILHVFPISFKLDGKEVLGRLEGMRGTKLEAKAIFITYSIQHLEDLISVIAEAGVETVDVMATPISMSNVILSDKQKIVGVGLVDIGHQTTTLSVFENGLPIYMHTFSIGSSDITNDIALGFKISLEEAEQLKIGNGSLEHSRKKLDEIIEARLSDIFEAIENHLKKLKRNELLPAGIVFVGGGANTHLLTEFSKSELQLPASIANTEMFGNSKTKLRDPSWLGTLSLIISGKNGDNYSNSSVKNLFKDIKSAIKSSVKQLMP